MPTRYAHINIIAHDWRKLCEFYEQIFDCKPFSSERNHHGEHIDKLTGMQSVRVQGKHLSVPGYGENGPDPPRPVQVLAARRIPARRADRPPAVRRQ